MPIQRIQQFFNMNPILLHYFRFSSSFFIIPILTFSGVIGNDVTVTMAAEAGQMELNAFEPVIFYKIFESIDTLKGAVETLIDNCITGITANRDHCKALVESSAALATALCPALPLIRYSLSPER